MKFDAQEDLPASIHIRHDLRPGDIGAVTRLHGLLYSAECGWDYTFEAYVAGPLSEFAKAHTERERLWIVEHDAEVAGSIGIVGAEDDAAQLRWFLLERQLRGHALGRRLIDDAIAFAASNDYARIFLWTASSLAAAARLYRAVGFELSEEHASCRWGKQVVEQRYELMLR